MHFLTSPASDALVAIVTRELRPEQSGVYDPKDVFESHEISRRASFVTLLLCVNVCVRQTEQKSSAGFRKVSKRVPDAARLHVATPTNLHKRSCARTAGSTE